MKFIKDKGPKLCMREKFARLKARLRDPEWRKYGGALIAGKMIGIAALFAIILGLPLLISSAGKVVGGTAHAEDANAPAAAAPAAPAPAAPAAAAPAAPAAGAAAPAAAAPAAAAAAPAAPPIQAADIVDPTKPGNVVNPLNTVWVLVAAFLVFGMQVGFTMLEAGFCRSRETVNVLVECVFDTCLCGILWYAWGFAFMFGHGCGFIGWGALNPDNTITSWFFLQHMPATYEGTGVAFLAVWIFQYAFADTCSTITSGSMIGRTAFVGDILYSICVTGFIYPIIGHWAWGPDGFLATMGSAGNFLPSLGMNFHDFAGSTVVHSIGGMVSIAGAIVLGPRLGRKFKRDGGAPMLPHDLTIAVCGGLLLWFGWYGFNPGSTLSAMDLVGIGRVAANTTLAACTGGFGAVFYLYFLTKKWDAGAITNGFLAGLVAITCPCYWVSPTGACILGLIAGVLVMLGVELLEYLRIDDPIGAWPVHGLCGVWGTLSLGLFASGEYAASGSSNTGVPVIDAASNPALTGLFYGGGMTVFYAQLIGSACICLATLAVSFAVMYAINAIGLLRLSDEGQAYGMDLEEHGISAYPEYVIAPSAAPSGMAPEMVNSVGRMEVSKSPATVH